MSKMSRGPAALALGASALGVAFAAISTGDYARHLDRQLHEMHCSFVPGMVATDSANACRTAMVSSYSSVMREHWWGGVPISLFGLGTYLFFAAFALALVVGAPRASRRAWQFLGIAGLVPLAASIVMALISALKIGAFCKTCVGLYVASVVLAGAGLWGWLAARRAFSAHAEADPEAPPVGHPALLAAWFAAMGACAVLPALVYVAALPDYRAKLLSCGKLTAPPIKAPVVLATAHPKRDVTLVIDPLCPSCKALDARLVSEGVLENLHPTVVLMPLDDSCNWMVDRAVHPGACLLSRVVLCSEARPREALDWMFANQEELASLGKVGEAQLKARVRTQFGASIDECVDSKATHARLNAVLHWAVDAHLVLSTPQVFLGDRHVCDEDTDLGLRYTLAQLAPEVLQ